MSQFSLRGSFCETMSSPGKSVPAEEPPRLWFMGLLLYAHLYSVNLKQCEIKCISSSGVSLKNP